MNENLVAQQECIAFHESAHAIVHHFYGHAISEVAIGENSGHCKTETADVEADEDTLRLLVKREWAKQKAIACCAGKAAMDRWDGRKADAGNNWEASNDYKQAYNIALKQSGGDSLGAEYLMSYFERRAEVIVERQWAKISKLAFALLDTDGIARHGKVQFSGEQIRQVLSHNGHSTTRSTLT